MERQISGDDAAVLDVDYGYFMRRSRAGCAVGSLACPVRLSISYAWPDVNYCTPRSNDEPRTMHANYIHAPGQNTMTPIVEVSA